MRHPSRRFAWSILSQNRFVDWPVLFSVPLCVMINTALAAEQQQSASRATQYLAVGAGQSMHSEALVQVVVALFFIVVMITGGAWLLRRVGHFNRSRDGAMRIIGVLPLGSRERAVLVQVGNRQILLGVAPGRVTTLHECVGPVEIDEPGDRAAVPLGRFGSIMRSLSRPARTARTDAG